MGADKNNIEKPKILPNCLIYNAGESISLSQWYKLESTDYPVCLVIFYRSHLQSGNTQMFDQFMATVRQQKLSPLAVAVTSLKEKESLTLLNNLIEQTSAKVILNTTGFASNRMGSPDLASTPTDFQSTFSHSIPVLQLILSSSTEDDWQQQSQGLRSRDVAMQVVLPEMDGRIITRAISFKASSYYDKQCQIELVRYAIHTERAQFVAQLAKRFVDLSKQKTIVRKRIALILANYPH